ncbi:ABC transporter substrate-binding protein [Mesorhizobium sp. M6A.T.Cr.TU.016.01.1.1]|uniref:ABC transporter substrate-binding protein n=1 Tax=Mesorhizobium sp. M6A.T.Cr.TU.016.01.1.1 TaxID=2493677 RepID=UPI000F750AD9|nr:ABC transporter substrate-binding protein [Mesorhizobium sp. M6A.T.Cr.TU.016.01.1.1]AZO66362.1 ABC transporter substrate-binding protein [Mesorhizobium sp. M6A.T.Cr.TU.016.01.1.1]
MRMLLDRRRFIQASSAVALGAVSCKTSRATAQSLGELRVALNGGEYAKACIEAYVKPFEAEMGIKVTPISDEVSETQLNLMISTNSVSIDVIPVSASMDVQAQKKGYLEKIDYSIYKKHELDGILDFTRSEYSVGSIVYAWCLVCNSEKYPASRPRPTSWSEFWDVSKYPGVRTLYSGQYGSEGPWEQALLADGVPAGGLYPMDIDRVFASLDKIKPHIRKWWSSGSEIQQMMHDKVVDLAQAFDGRATVLSDEGAPIEINRNQSVVTWESWGIPKGSPNKQNAQKFIEFITRADRQAAFVQLMPYGPANQNALKLMPEDVARKSASHPAYLASSITMNHKWYAEQGADGTTNADRLMQRWNEWVLQ